MYSDEIISLQIGNFANYVGAHVRNIQQDLVLSDEDLVESSVYNTTHDDTAMSRCVMVDMFENIGNYPSEVQGSSNQYADWNGKVAKSEVSRGNVDSWTDIMMTELHPKSLVQLPKWVTAKNFDTYHKGQNHDLVSEALIEEITDKLRYFAEGCNHVSAVQCYFDLQQGFGGLAATLVESIKDDIGNVCIPVFGFTETEAVAQNHDILGNVKSLNLPLSFHSLMEHSSVFLPMDCHHSIAAMLNSKSPARKHTLSQAALITALAIESCTLFDIKAGRRSTELHSVVDWVHAVTQGDRFPLASVEAYFSDLSASQFSSSNQELEALIKRISESTGSSSRSNSSSGSVNPFMHSLSAVDFGHFSTSATVDANVFHGTAAVSSAYSMPFSNVVSTVGGYSTDFFDALQARTRNTLYRISKANSCSSPLYLPTSQFTSVFGPLSFQQQQLQQEYQSVSVVAAVGTNDRISGCLRRMAAGWSEGAEISKVQLQKVGLMSDEVNEINEQLLSYSQRYNNGDSSSDSG